MTNEQKLEHTLCNMFSYNLMGKVNGKESIDKLLGIYGTGSHSLTICFRVNNHNTLDYDCNLQEFKPLLHSFDKITEPILEGGLIPIVEIRQLFYKTTQYDNGGSFKSELIYNGNEFVIEVNDCCYTGDSNKKYFEPIGYELTCEILEWLKANHFNIYDLPKDMYIEKSTLKI